MDAKRNSLRIVLTPDQKATVQEAIHRDVEALELSIEELEQRIVPAKGTVKWF